VVAAIANTTQPTMLFSNLKRFINFVIGLYSIISILRTVRGDIRHLRKLQIAKINKKSVRDNIISVA
jgi:hypothetical protein